MKKQSQKTYLDTDLTRDPRKKEPPVFQRTLFKTDNSFPIYDSQSKKNLEFEDVSKNKEKEKLDFISKYPNLDKSNISLKDQDLFDQDKRELISNFGDKSRTEIFDYSDKEINDLAKEKILSRYNILRKKVLEFHNAYNEANQLASQEYSVPDFKDYDELLLFLGKATYIALTKEIGRLFGLGSKYEKVLKLINGINIFNISKYDFNSKLSEIESYVKEIDSILDNYNRRKKLIKKLELEINKEVQEYINTPDWKSFSIWMNDYFPQHKQYFFDRAISILKNSRDSDYIGLNDLIKFKTFKSIYEKAKNSTTTAFRDTIAGTNSLEQLVSQEFIDVVNDLLNSKISLFLLALKSIPSNETITFNTITKILKDKLNFDIRNISTFLTNYAKKNNLDINKSLIESIISTFDNNGPEDDLKYLLKTLTFNEIYKFYSKFSMHNNFAIGKKNIEDYLKLNQKELNEIANKVLLRMILSKIDIVNGQRGFISDTSDEVADFSKLFDYITYTKDANLSIDNLANKFHAAYSFFPKELVNSSIRNALRETDSVFLKNIITLLSSNSTNFAVNLTVKFIFEILNKFQKLEHNSFYKIIIDFRSIRSLIQGILNDLPKSLNNDSQFIMSLLLSSIKNYNNLLNDLRDLRNFINVIHNTGANLDGDSIKLLISNKNYFNIEKIGIVKKLYKAYIAIANVGGTEGIKNKFKEYFDDLIANGFISKDFEKNIKIIEDFFKSNKEISPASPEFKLIFETTSSMESDLATLQLSSSLKDMLDNYQKKNDRLFDLSMSIDDNLRFRVLKDKDPRIMRIGIETDCCQRIGGVGEVAARDSFVNPLSSVLILEWNHDDQWKLLSQSYFHYVPSENGYILDNVEYNIQNVNLYQQATGINLTEVYALLGDKVKNELKVKYLLAGKGYSKIDTHSFEKNKRYSDPRFFDPKALTEKDKDFYSDFDEKNSMDLFQYKKDLNKIFNKLERYKKSKANIRSLVLSIIKKAQSQENVRTLTGVNQLLLDGSSWENLNNFMNVLNNSLLKLGQGKNFSGQPINFQSVIRNKSQSTEFSGSLKDLFDISIDLYDFVSKSQANKYSNEEIKTFIKNLINKINQMSFVESEATSIKSSLITSLNKWLSIYS